VGSVEVRTFRRGDRDQLASLVNAHAQCVVPGVSVSVNAVLSQLEREPGEFIVDPWVAERLTLVAEQRHRVVAAAHVLRYGGGDEVGESYRGVGEIRWLLSWPNAPFWPDAQDGGDAVAAAAVSWLTRSGAGRIIAEGSLPAPGVYGIPEQWPHIHAILRRAGFTPGDETETVFLAEIERLARPHAPVDGLTTTRTLGVTGTCFTAWLGEKRIGYIEVENRLGDTGRLAHQAGWADIGNLWVDEPHRRHGIATWLLGRAAEWLHLGHADRLLDYTTPDQADYLAFLHRAGFTELTRTTRSWRHDPGHPDRPAG
jgi:GNAT superfamily N-acetyltransferase